MKLTRRNALLTLGSTLAVPYVRPSWAQAGTVNVYNWSDYIDETVLADFTKETGIPTYKWSVADYDACVAGIAKVEAEFGAFIVEYSRVSWINATYLTHDSDELAAKYGVGKS